MAEIRIYDGTAYIGVEVSDELALAYAEMERSERLTERKETRRHQSLDKSLEHGFDIADSSENTFEKIELSERIRQLYKAIAKLPPEQRKLLNEVYFEYITQTEIARREGVTKCAVNKRLSRILARLKKLLQ